MILLRLIMAGLWKPIAGLAALAGVWLAGRRSATQAAKIDTLERNNEAYEVRNEVENRLAGSDAHKRLRDEWSK
jgi:hypothetical protein